MVHGDPCHKRGQERTNWTACETPGRHHEGRKGPFGQPGTHRDPPGRQERTLDSLQGTREAGKDQLDSLGGTREAPEAPEGDRKGLAGQLARPGRHQGGRKGQFGQPGRHQGGNREAGCEVPRRQQGGRKGSVGHPGKHQGGTRHSCATRGLLKAILFDEAPLRPRV